MKRMRAKRTEDTASEKTKTETEGPAKARQKAKAKAEPAEAMGKPTRRKQKAKMVEEVQPVRPIEPVEPVQAVEEVQPVRPVEPVEPVQPVEPVEPVEPLEPVHPIEQIEQVQPVEPAETVGLVETMGKPTRRKPKAKAEAKPKAGKAVTMTPAEYSKLLKKWKGMSGDDRRRFIDFAYILCDYFWDDIGEWPATVELPDSEKDFALGGLPEDIVKAVTEKDYGMRIRAEKLALIDTIEKVVKAVGVSMMSEFDGMQMTDEMKAMIISSFRRTLEATLRGAANHPELVFIKDSDDGLSSDAYVSVDGEFGLRYGCFIRCGISGMEVKLEAHDGKMTELK